MCVSHNRDVLAGIKFHVPPNGNVLQPPSTHSKPTSLCYIEVTRRRLGIPPKSPLTRSEKEVARLRSERLPENSIFLSDGPRLRVFSEPGPDTQLLPPAPPNIAEVGIYNSHTHTHTHSHSQRNVAISPERACGDGG